MDKELIRFNQVEKEYKSGQVSTQVLKGVNFSIDKGQLAVIVGASGAGKSTILNLLGGMDTPTRGKILVDGEDISKFNEKKLTEYRASKVGFVFQFYNLIPNLNALENVVFGSEVKKDSLDASQVLKQVGLAEKKKSFPSMLSGGEQQRVAIARAIAKNPLLLLCDEPTGALDYKTSKTVLATIESLNREMKKTIILITHNDVLSAMADKVITNQDGLVKNITTNEKRIPVKELEW